MIIKGYFENMDIYVARKEKIIEKYNKENNIARLAFRTIHNEQFYVREIEGKNWGINVTEELKDLAARQAEKYTVLEDFESFNPEYMEEPESYNIDA